MSALETTRRLLFGKKLDALNPQTRHHMALIAFLAWIGLGADGLSSSCYGPEEAFLALGAHPELGLYLAIATAFTVFVISLAYNQVIELFPSGGGGYKAATELIGPYAGLVSGSALIVDYVLTIAISVASGTDALFSLLPAAWHSHKLGAEIGATIVLLMLNLRGVRESILILLPIFLGFFLSHAALIVYGIGAHSAGLHLLWPRTLMETQALADHSGWMFVCALFLRAYSVGAGTYTGIEAVSNNVQLLKEPRVRTGQWTMAYMAASLAFTAGGITLLYLLWHAQPVAGQTLNAVTFRSIIGNLGWSPAMSDATLAATLALEAGLLLVAANTGFLGGPAVLASMAADRWVPRQFRQLSSRMVTQNGVLLMGGAALVILWLSRGSVALLVVLYSINVFLTFTLSLFGLCRHWWEQRLYVLRWRGKFLLALLGLAVTGSILCVIVAEKFTHGGWATMLITSFVAAMCLLIRRHYSHTRELVQRVERRFDVRQSWDGDARPDLPDPAARTAVFLVGASRGSGWMALQWVLETFPGAFANFIFVSVGEVDRESYNSERTLKTLQARLRNSLNYFTSYCASRGFAARSYEAYGADPLAELSKLADRVLGEFPNSVCFATKLLFEDENFFTRLLHNQMPMAMQRRMMLRGQPFIVIPVRIDENAG
ncbi:MAG TPA: APC family permease [Solimonas sp.]|nr:APC family permease [Solimonas sp.]